MLARFRSSVSSKGVTSIPQGYKDDEWVLEYRCSKNYCNPIAKKLDDNGWKVYKQVYADHVYKAIKHDNNISDVIEYYEQFEQKPEIITASIYPNKINSGIK